MQPSPLSFSQRLDGRFDGMVRHKDALSLADTMAHLDGWYLMEPTAALPEQSVQGKAARQHLEALLQEILQEERGVWSTMVYVQSMKDPWIIKVYHPRRAGCGCGAGSDITPWWVFSRIKPETVAAWNPQTCAMPEPQTKAWWKKLL